MACNTALTGAGKIASSITGNYASDFGSGSNIYVAIWVAFIASVRVTDKWKEARAMSFAKTAGAKTAEERGDTEDDVAESGNGSEGTGENGI